MSIRLDEKVAVVTGAAAGLGRAYALALAAAGARVVVNDLPASAEHLPAGEGADAVVRQIRSQGGHAIAVFDSVADSGSAQRLIREAVSVFGRVDILVNNAGIMQRRPIVETSDAEFDATIAVHLRGTFLCTREAMLAMSQGGRGGRIINTTSGRAYYAPSAGTASYAAAKGGIISLTGVTAAEGGEFGITCNAVSPLAQTALAHDFLGDDDDPQLDPATVAPLIVFLASEAAAHVTGRIFRIARGELALVGSTVGPALQPANAIWTAEELATRIGEILL